METGIRTDRQTDNDYLNGVCCSLEHADRLMSAAVTAVTDSLRSIEIRTGRKPSFHFLFKEGERSPTSLLKLIYKCPKTNLNVITIWHYYCTQ